MQRYSQHNKTKLNSKYYTKKRLKIFKMSIGTTYIRAINSDMMK